jgi:hypothetical protein
VCTQHELLKSLISVQATACGWSIIDRSRVLSLIIYKSPQAVYRARNFLTSYCALELNVTIYACGTTVIITQRPRRQLASTYATSHTWLTGLRAPWEMRNGGARFVFRISSNAIDGSFVGLAEKDYGVEEWRWAITGSCSFSSCGGSEMAERRPAGPVKAPPRDTFSGCGERQTSGCSQGCIPRHTRSRA